tara:strand:- start:3924 stop:4151 length:228 start_codon:yes stop_codon:yes gene_type:complete
MEIEFRISEEEKMHPITIAGSGLKPIVIINVHGQNRVWLSLNRNNIPGIVASLQSKLTEICDSYLKECYWMEGNE